MDNSTPGYSCTAMHHVIFLRLFCDGMFIISGVSAFPQPPLSAATSVIIYMPRGNFQRTDADLSHSNKAE